MKNKPEWLDAALSGHPVVLRDGSKAYVRHWDKELEPYYPICGGIVLGCGRTTANQWTACGSHSRIDEFHQCDIIGLWQEPAPVFEYWHLINSKYVALAMDEDGYWHAYSSKPFVSDRHSGWMFDGADCFWVSELFTKDVLPTVSDWRQSLILRPEGENK